jgi:hypothetical protein
LPKTSRTTLKQPSARGKRYILFIAPHSELNAHSTHQIIAVWGMKCVGYDVRFEKHLARSLKAIKPSPSTSSKKRKPVTKGSGVLSEDDEEGRRVSAESDVSPSSKRQRVAKGKAKLVQFDWSDANNHGDSQDEDYIPASS